ncbi:MAG: adenylate/guanylate cyclase domain-containing protein [Phycisphaerales bacterium]|nr:adenylate/guanylate cyclase domain-containing protein [Phycisphaerae bacterium]NNF45063.1 adenylate/guanylate cyclase domain-containing protein [Phycisphaerales bacterium]NNM25892.1 adenylate/guanylate cyclase domain-containing protein [Phycisphaerales bacterium]
MKRFRIFEFLAGLLVTLLVVTVDLLGGFTGVKRMSVDLRFALVPRPDAPMTSEIVHVDIDDQALELVGRWPWDRRKLADVIRELDRAGVRTIAIDLLLADPQQYPEGTGERDVDHDAELAQAIADASCVLGVVLAEGTKLDEPWWNNDRGRVQLERLLRELGNDIQLTPEEILDGGLLTGARREDFRLRPVFFKRMALWQWLLTRPAGAPIDKLAVEAAVAPRLPENYGQYPEEPLIDVTLAQMHAWRLLTDGDPDGSSHLDQAPLPTLARAAAGVGFVNMDRHQDSVVREVGVERAAPGGAMYSLGLRAAAVHQDLPLDRITTTDDELRFGDTTLPVRTFLDAAGKLRRTIWIDWPTSRDAEHRWAGLLRQNADDDPAAGHLSIRTLVELGAARRTVASIERSLRAQAASILVGEDVPEDRVALNRKVQDQLEFDEEPGETSPAHAAWNALLASLIDGERKISETEDMLEDVVANKLAFIGFIGTGTAADFVNTPIAPQTPGVVVHAAMAHMALTGSAVHFLRPWTTALLCLALGVGAALIAARLKAAPSTAAVAALLIVYAFVAVWCFARADLIMPIVAPLTAAAAAWIVSTVLEAAISQRDRARVTRQFGARVSGQLVTHLLENPESVSVQGVEREITTLIGDLANFTAVSEVLGGEKSVETLNRYLGAMTETLIEHNAYVNKFLGDGVMAFWSAFGEDPEQAASACQSALECQAVMDRLNRDRRLRQVPDLSLRVGISTGRAVVGDCGAPPMLNDYTAIGDPVNLAARLESANKQFGTHILIDGRTHELLGHDPGPVQPIGRIMVVGQTTVTRVYHVLPEDPDPNLLELSGCLVEAFTAGDAEAVAVILDGMESRLGPECRKLVKVYRDYLARMGDGFDGALHLSEK